MEAKKAAQHPQERQEGLAPVSPMVYLQQEVEILRKGNAALLKELARVKAWYEKAQNMKPLQNYVAPWNKEEA